VNFSEKLAQTELQLTLEFLLECIRGMEASRNTPQILHLCLDYMRPWLPNLSKFAHLTNEADSPEKVAKTKEFIDSLIAFTILERSVSYHFSFISKKAETDRKQKKKKVITIVLSKVWEGIGTVSDILEMVTDRCIELGIKHGHGTSELEVIGSIVAAIASHNQRIVSGVLIHRLLNVLSSVPANVARLDESKEWGTIKVLLHLLLMLSFENLIYVQQFLPEVLHIIMLVFGVGSSNIRATTHGLLINIFHSLYTTSVSREDKLQGLSFHLSEFSQPQFKLLFGIGGQNINAFSATSPDEKLQEKVSMTTIDTVASALFSTLNSISPLNNAIGTTWHARWLSLTTKVAFTNRLSLQPRACVTLGVLCRSSSLVTDDIMENVLSTLSEALRVITRDGDEDLAIALILALNHLYEFLPPTSPYFVSLFWVAISILQIGDVKLFNAAVSLLEVILRVQDYHEGFRSGVENCFMAVREGAIDQILSKLDQISGLSFKSSFSFSIAGHLLKGFSHPKSKETTSQLLSSFLDIAVKTGGSSYNILGK
jgi:neurofibromin 1